MPYESVEGLERFREAVKRDPLTVVCFTAHWCTGCVQMEREIPKIVKEFPACHFIKVDADSNQDILGICQVNLLPTYMLVKHGQRIDAVIGARPSELRSKIRSALSGF